MLQKTDEKLINQLIIEYEYIIKIIISKYKILYNDYDDALQEGRLGLLKAINAYEENKGASFTTFASLCIDRQILTFLRTKNRKKNKIYSYCYSLESYQTLIEIKKTNYIHQNIEEYVLSKVHYEHVFANTLIKMSKLEKDVYSQYVKGYSVSELSEIHNISKKQVYVIIAKVKKRIEQKLNHN